jgi:ribosomal subunit interface protein
MAAQLQITVHDMPYSAVFETRVRGKLARLERIYPRITAFHVTLEAPHHRHRESGQFCVKLDIKMPGAEIVVTRDHDEDIYVALSDACKAARRQLIEHAERGQGGDNSHRPRSRSLVDAEAAGHE